MKRATMIGIMLIVAGLSAACGPRVTRIAPTAAATETTPTAEPAMTQPAAAPETQPATTDGLPTSTAAAIATATGPAVVGPAGEAGAGPRVRPLTAAINVRGGPGIGFAVIATLLREETAAVLGRNLAGDWYLVQADDRPAGWVAANLVELVAGNAADIAVVATPAAVAPPSRTPTPNPAPTEPARPTPPTAEPSPTVNSYP
ncbi:MAG TPA: SH3 domain-containing protein [Promineifilum sp.]|nr:SH3 domain-containing protein [Promineifilum sp.]